MRTKLELRKLRDWLARNRRQLLVTAGGGCLVITLMSSVVLIKTYSHYSAIVDARLSDRSFFYPAGIYTAPRRVSVGQRIAREDLVERLLRSGYIEAKHAGDFAFGSFGILQDGVELRTNKFAGTEHLPASLRVRFNKDAIVAIEDSASQEKLSTIDLPAEMLTADIDANSQTRRATNFDDLPPILVSALTSIEDRRFFEHRGVDARAMLRALWKNIAGGRIRQGGSTITQQLIKNQFLTPERTYTRKVAEAVMAIALERRLTKKQILALYCERVYLGHSGHISVYGFKQGARIFFNKELRDLSLSEVACLAGLGRAPNRYSLQSGGGSAATERRNMVLQAMTEAGTLTPAEAESAKAEHLAVVAPRHVDEGGAPHFVDYIRRELDSHTFKEDEWPQMRIETTLDVDLQQAANQAVTRHLTLISKVAGRKDGSRPEVALIAIDPHTGAILAMVGGSNYATSQLNRVTDAMRQPGSVFKPIVYAAALSHGFSPAMKFLNAPRDLVFGQNAVYRPENFGRSYSHQQVTLREAMVRSLNVVAVDAAMQVGLGNVASMAGRLGLPEPRAYPSMALGAFEASPLDVARAYTAFANNGTRVDPFAIRTIKASGEVMVNGAATTASVLPPSLAYLITDTLVDVVNRGTARRVRGLGYRGPAAGKTGTSRDAWFVGYTPNLLVVVWVGYDDNSDLKLTGGEAAVPIWTDFVMRAHELRPDLAASRFVKPGGVETIEIDPENGAIANEFCPRRQRMLVSVSTLPGFCHQHTGQVLEREHADLTLQADVPLVTAEEALPIASLPGIEGDRHGRPLAKHATPASLPRLTIPPIVP